VTIWYKGQTPNCLQEQFTYDAKALIDMMEIPWPERNPEIIGSQFLATADGLHC